MDRGEDPTLGWFSIMIAATFTLAEARELY